MLGRASAFDAPLDEVTAASRAAEACAVTVPFAPDFPRVRASRPTRNARSESSLAVAVPKDARVAARAVSRDFLRELPKPRTPILQCPTRPQRPPGSRWRPPFPDA